MHRTDADGNVANLFNGGDPLIPRLPTQVDVPWLNAVQEELANTIEGAGITLVKGTNTQLLAAVALKAVVNTFLSKQIFHSGTTRTLVFEIGDQTNVIPRKVRMYFTTSGSLCEVVSNCSWNGTNWVPDESGVICSKMTAGPFIFQVGFFTASGTTPFADSSFNSLGISMNNTSFEALGKGKFTNASGFSAPVLQLVQNEPTRAHIEMNGLSVAPTSAPVGSLYADTSGVLWICTNATGPVWTKVGTQT